MIGMSNSLSGGVSNSSAPSGVSPGGYGLVFGRPLSVASVRTTPAGSMSSSAPVVSAPAGSYNAIGAGTTVLGEPFAVFVGALALLGLMGWFSNHPDTLGGANPAFLKVGGYNFMAVGVTSVLFILSLKLLANSTKFPGFYEFANAI